MNAVHDELRAENNRRRRPRAPEVLPGVWSESDPVLHNRCADNDLLIMSTRHRGRRSLTF